MHTILLFIKGSKKTPVDAMRNYFKFRRGGSQRGQELQLFILLPLSTLRHLTIITAFWVLSAIYGPCSI
jgi:hypothetical protein